MLMSAYLKCRNGSAWASKIGNFDYLPHIYACIFKSAAMAPHRPPKSVNFDYFPHICACIFKSAAMVRHRPPKSVNFDYLPHAHAGISKVP